ncbi:hypothetical protein OY671_011117, partial [Metschnikowia pulcherrima]
MDRRPGSRRLRAAARCRDDTRGARAAKRKRQTTGARAGPLRQRAAIGHTSTCTCTTERKATMPPQPDTLDLVPDARAVASAIEWLEAIAERDAWSPKSSFGSSLSSDEASTNIVSY